MKEPVNLSKPSTYQSQEPKEQPLNNQLNNNSVPEKKGVGSRTEFTSENFKKHVQDRSIKVLWERGYICTCISKRTQSPRATCPRCHGTGVAYKPAQHTFGMIQSQMKGANNIDLGLVDSGTAIFTTRFETRMGFRDRITIPDVVIPQSMIYHITPERQRKGVRLKYDVREVEFITGETRDLTENDYYIEDGKLFVTEEFQNQNISINIFMTLRYIVMDLLKESRYQYTENGRVEPTFENFPQKILLKREDNVVPPEPFILDNMDDDKERREAEAKINNFMKPSSTTPSNPEGNVQNRDGFFGSML